MSSPPQTPAPVHLPWRPAATTAHLTLLGVVGSLALGLLAGYIVAAVVLIPIAGVGVLMLVGLVYLLYAMSWWETGRIAGLYRLDIPQPRFTPRTAPTFGGWVKSLGAQLASASMWRSLMSAFVAVLLGTIHLVALSALLWSLASIITRLAGRGPGFVPDMFSGQYGYLGLTLILMLAIATSVAMIAAHRTLTVALVRGGRREEQLAAEAQTSRVQREGAVRAADVERTRIERDLHDGVQPRLVSVAMTLGLAKETLDTDPAAAKELISEAHSSTKAAITELRQLARGIHTAVLDDRGLDAALSALAARSHIPVELDVDLPHRVARDAETALYFVVAETLTNAAKHSRAGTARVTVRAGSDPEPRLWARIEDDGIGGAAVTPGGGLDGITNRVLAAGGTINVSSPTGGPTIIEVNLPCAS